MSGALISPLDHPSEEFECLDCSLVGTLSEHGRCPRCGSDAVMQFMVLEKVGRWIKVGDARYWVPTDQPYANRERNATFVPEQLRRSRTSTRRSAPVLALAAEKRYA